MFWYSLYSQKQILLSSPQKVQGKHLLCAASVLDRAWQTRDRDTRLGRKQFTKLFVYGGAEHKHAAQKPEALDINTLI